MLGQAKMWMMSGIVVDEPGNTLGFYDYAITLSPDYYYRVDEVVGQTVAVDDIGTGNGTLNDTPILQTQGLVLSEFDNKCFHGGSDIGYLQFPTASSIADDTAFSLYFIYKLNNTTGDHQGLCLMKSSVTEPLIVFLSQNISGYNDICFGSPNDFGRHGFDVPINIFDGDKEAHICIVFDGAGIANSNYTVYVNGVDTAIGTPDAFASFSNPSGHLFPQNGPTAFGWDGFTDAAFDEIMLFSDELTAQEVLDLYEAAVATFYSDYVLTLSPFAYYRFNDVSGTVAVDSSGNENDAEYVNSDLNQASLLDYDTDSSVYHAGAHEHITTNMTTPDTTKLSASFIVKGTYSGAPTFICDADGVGNITTTKIWIKTHSTGHWYIAISSESGSWQDYTSTLHGLTDNQLYHIVSVVDGSSIKIYVDGVLSYNQTAGVSLAGAGVDDVRFGRLGAHTGSYYFIGQMDEVALYNKALTATEAKNLYWIGSGIAYSSYIDSLSPIAHWLLDESVGATTAVDQEGTYDGTYNNTPVLEAPGLIANSSNTAMTLDSGTNNMSFTAISLARTYSIVMNIRATSFSTLNALIHGSGCGWYLANGVISYRDLTNSSLTLSLNTNYNIVLIDDASTASVYVNGVDVTGSIVSNANFSPNRLGIDTAGITQPFIGTIDDTAIFDKALTATEIDNIYKLSIGDYSVL